MNYKQMILVEYLLNNILNGIGDSVSKLIFEMDNQLYTGDFSLKNNHGQYTVHRYIKGFGFRNNLSILDTSKLQELRSALFNEAFGNDPSVDNDTLNQYTKKLHYLVLNDVIAVISNLNAEDYFSDNVDFPEIIFNLKNLESDNELEHYRAIDKTFKPVSFTKGEKFLY